jgi:serine phosphatase RsbU (regulator of sigma subunit)
MQKVIADKMTGINFACTEKGKLIRTIEYSDDIVTRSQGFFAKNKKTGLYDSKFLDLSECEPGDFIYSYADSFGNFWLSYAGMLVHYDVNLPPVKPVPFNTLITRVVIGKDSVLFSGAGTNNNAGTTIDFKNNNILFRFAAPSFDHEELTLYSYILEGFDKDTSTYTTAFEKEYTNLPEGDYVFTVRSINALGHHGIVGSYRFTVLPPWYRTIWAYIAYTILFAFIIFLSIRISAQQLRRQKERLEVIVADRTMEVVLQKQKIETQNFELESAYKGIQDSIHYAERIQHAILPLTSEIQTAFPDSFVFFRPRDIVSGDFYWLVKRGNLSWLACVDCTGHGVPGAFMSMIGNTLLNEIVLEKNIESPEKILDLLHVRIRQALRQDAGGETRDGMDISLCLINEETKTLSHAGANRALWIIRNNELIVLPPDKLSIGGDQENIHRQFTLRTFDLQKGDCIYMSSDGYADQFGGVKGKKFMVKKLQALLLKINELPMSEQGILIENNFIEWKGSFEQVDDVLLIGFRNIS